MTGAPKEDDVLPDDDRPPLRDRNWFFHHLLNGSRDEYERVAPRWREQRRLARWANSEAPSRHPHPGRPASTTPSRTHNGTKPSGRRSAARRRSGALAGGFSCRSG
jgi:hypothetical protein